MAEHTPTDLAAFTELLGPLVGLLPRDLSDPGAALAALEREAPPEGDLLRGLRTAAFAGAAAGWLLPRAHGATRFGRIAKDLSGFSIDAVWMDGAGPRHRHPRGEIDLLWRDRGSPEFDGHPPGWAVYGPDSVHVPAVSGGSMLILYFLPGGAIEWVAD